MNSPKHTRKNRVQRYRELLDVGTACVRDFGSIRAVTRHDIARRAGCTKGLVSHYFGSLEDALYAFVENGLAQGDVYVALAALSERHPLASTIGDELREAIAYSITGAPK